MRLIPRCQVLEVGLGGSLTQSHGFVWEGARVELPCGAGSLCVWQCETEEKRVQGAAQVARAAGRWLLSSGEGAESCGQVRPFPHPGGDPRQKDRTGPCHCVCASGRGIQGHTFILEIIEQHRVKNKHCF